MDTKQQTRIEAVKAGIAYGQSIKPVMRKEEFRGTMVEGRERYPDDQTCAELFSYAAYGCLPSEIRLI